MKPLFVKDCIWPNIIRVLDTQRPDNNFTSNTVFAVFSRSLTDGKFCGLATSRDVVLHPEWIFADLVGHRPVYSVAPEADLHKAMDIMDQHDTDALSILDATGAFIGAITRQSVLQSLLQHEHDLLEEASSLRQKLHEEHQDTLIWSERLSNLYTAAHNLLGVLAHTSVEKDILQTGIEALSRLVEAKYGAIGITDQDEALRVFVYTGIPEEEVKRISHLPEGRGLLGVVLHENTTLRLDDMSRDPRSVGFPPNHPPMKTLLAVPVSYKSNVYGRVYLCDKLNGKPFDAADEILVKSFAHSLSLALDNAREKEALEKAHQELNYLAHFDTVTNLPNRVLLTDRVNQSILQAQRNGKLVVFMLLDLDNFKNVNDSLGHACGDGLLKVVGQRISQCIRGDDAVARLGGDEFVVILSATSDVKNASYVASKILATMAAPFEIEQRDVYVNASIGISIYPNDAKDAGGLQKAADIAMYHAKKLGKNNFQFFTDSMNAEAHKHYEMRQLLHQAIERNELEVHYQPQINTRNMQIVGMEALLRWNNPKLGSVPPSTFIPLAEEAGLIEPIGDWVLHVACAQAKQWELAGTPVRVAVNVSGRQLQPHSRDRLLNTVKEALSKSGLYPDMLELEITENILMENTEVTKTILGEIKKMGVRLSLDDFGTGYSSLSYLRQLSGDTLKIDQSFIKELGNSSSDTIIVRTIISMARALKMDVVAEGVEEEDQIKRLKNMGCYCIQGYYYSRPLAVKEATQFLQRSKK